jgi:hypothetical protein
LRCVYELIRVAASGLQAPSRIGVCFDFEKTGRVSHRVASGIMCRTHVDTHVEGSVEWACCKSAIYLKIYSCMLLLAVPHCCSTVAAHLNPPSLFRSSKPVPRSGFHLIRQAHVAPASSPSLPLPLHNDIINDILDPRHERPVAPTAEQS